MRVPEITFSKLDKAAWRIRALDAIKYENQIELLCISDAHIDNKKSDVKLMQSHMAEAKKRGSWIIFNGDTFCAMQGKWDKRADQDQLRPELHGNNYLDKLVQYAESILEPYAENILLIGHGNHETSIIRHHQTSLIDRLIQGLKKNKKCQSDVGAYMNHIQIGFQGKTSKQTVIPKTLTAYHGAGGGAFVTKGSIDLARMAQSLPDSHIVWIGHKHNELTRTEPRTRINAMGTIYHDEQFGFMTPGYKSWDDEAMGWEIERSPHPKPIGAAWLTFTPGRKDYKTCMEVEFEFRRAK